MEQTTSYPIFSDNLTGNFVEFLFIYK